MFFNTRRMRMRGKKKGGGGFSGVRIVTFIN